MKTPLLSHSNNENETENENEMIILNGKYNWEFNFLTFF